MPRALATVSFLSFTGSSSVMIHLIYGIIRDQGASGPPFPVGPDGSPVAVVATEGIAAASAAVRQCPSSSELASVLAFAHVVSALHSQCAVLPMRFGSCVNSLPELTEMLTLRAATFRTALDVIEGCEEMGLRAVWNAPDIAPNEPHRIAVSHGGVEVPPRALPSPGIPGSGAEYLARLRARYDMRRAYDQVKNALSRPSKARSQGYSSLMRPIRT